MLCKYVCVQLPLLLIYFFSGYIFVDSYVHGQLRKQFKGKSRTHLQMHVCQKDIVIY